jgi:predicted Zn-dependent protease
MVTKPKTAGSAHSTTEKSLEAMFSEAIDLADRKDYDKALVALTALAAEAAVQGQLGMARSAKNYILALQARTEKPDNFIAKPELAAQVLLNRGAAAEALALLDEALKADGQDARLFYLKATAHAQLEDAEVSAQALKQAVRLNQDFLHQFRLERDFDRVRSLAPFVSNGLD